METHSIPRQCFGNGSPKFWLYNLIRSLSSPVFGFPFFSRSPLLLDRKPRLSLTQKSSPALAPPPLRIARLLALDSPFPAQDPRPLALSFLTPNPLAPVALASTSSSSARQALDKPLARLPPASRSTYSAPSLAPLTLDTESRSTSSSARRPHLLLFLSIPHHARISPARSRAHSLTSSCARIRSPHRPLH